jgi:hypothetical protein
VTLTTALVLILLLGLNVLVATVLLMLRKHLARVESILETARQSFMVTDSRATDAEAVAAKVERKVEEIPGKLVAALEEKVASESGVSHSGVFPKPPKQG